MRIRIRHKAKTIICLLMVLCMMFSIMPASVLAEETETKQTEEETTASETEQTEDSTSIPETKSEETPEPASDETTPEITPKPSSAPITTRGVSDPINAALYDDSGAWVNFDGVSDSATIGYASDAEKDYNMQVVLTFPSGATDKSATITLAEGLKFQDYGSGNATVAQMLDGTVVNNTNAAPYGLSSSMSNTGSKTYSFVAGAEVLTLSLTVRADSRYWFDNDITDAITVTMSYGGARQAEVKLESLTVDSSNKRLGLRSGNYTGYAPTDTNIIVENLYRMYLFNLSSSTSRPHFLECFEATITVDDPNCVVTNADTANWIMSDNGGGSYTFTYIGTSGATLAGDFTIPVRFNFPSSDFSAGAVVTATRTATAKLYGGKEVTWQSSTMTFTIAGGANEVFVNYESVALATSAGLLNGRTTSRTGTTSPTLSGVVGYYTVGNKGATDSGEQIVELHFDQDKLGVLALDLAIPYYASSGTSQAYVTEVEYQTVNSGGWVTKSGLRLTAVNSSNQYCYVSWATLGITTDPITDDNYITAIRYTLDSIPASTMLSFGESSVYRNGIYGVTLEAGINTTATSTVAVYASSDADDESKWTIGVIESDHTQSFVGIRFTNVSNTSVTKSANETFGFSQRIVSAGSSTVGNMLQNSAVEHPIIYLRSESGNPVTNLKIENNRGTDITNDCNITWTYDGLVYTYKIDTANVPRDGAAIAQMSILSNGLRSSKYLTVSYDITTKSTDNGTYDYVDMLFVETPLTTRYSTSTSTYAQTTTGTHPTYTNIGTGTGRVWWLPTGNLGSYTITPRTDIAVGLSAKHYRADDYSTWTEGGTPIAIGVGDNSAMDIKLDVTNLSGTAVTNDTIIYMPIPKFGDDWGDLMYNSEAFEFSMNLKSQITLPSGTTGTVTYGSVTPTDDGATLSGSTFESWDAANAANYNCIKIVLNGLTDSSDPVSITMKVAVDQATQDDGLVNIWSPLYYEDLTNSEGKVFKLWVQGSYLATETAMGELQGWIWLDADIDGVKDASETSLNVAVSDGWTVSIYAAGTAGTGTPLQTVKIGENDDGSTIDNYYHITDILSGNGHYDLVVTNPDNTEYIFTRVAAGTTDNKALGTVSNQHATAIIDNPTALIPTSGSLEADDVYNIGVIPASTEISMSWQSQDNAKGTVTVTGADTGSATTSSGKPYETIKASVSVTAATGYTFQGWATSATGAVDSSISKTGPYGASGLYGYDDANYYAVFTPNTYTISYVDHSGNPITNLVLPGTGATLPTSYIYGIGATIGDDELYTRTGYTFLGWYDAATGGNKVMSITGTSTGDIILYARWEDNTYNITYENLYGVSNSNPATYTYGVGVTSFANPGERIGYTFAGWYDAATGGNIVTSISDTATEGVVLYARWTINTYTVTFNAGANGTMVPEPATKNVTHGSSVTDVPVITTDTGYVFIGWKSNQTNGIYDNTAVMNYSVTANVTFTAQYERSSKAVVIFDYNGGEDTSGNAYAVMSDYPGETLTAPTNPARTGYTFAGWDTTPSATFGAADSVTTYTAQWTVNSYTVTFAAGTNGIMTPDPATESTNYGASVANVPIITADTGYVFTGWKSSLTGAIYSSDALTLLPVTANVTFTAQYADSEKATVIFDYNGGTASGVTSSSVSGKPGTTYTIPIPTRTGYTLSGWDSTPSGTFGAAGSVTIYTAQWTINTYTVTFAAGTNGTMAPDPATQSVNHGANVTSVPSITANTGFVFLGWSDGSGIYDEAAVLSYPVTANVTFTAQYTDSANTTVVFDYNGGTAGSVTSSSFSGKPGTTYTIPVPARTGYTLSGWSPDSPNGIFGTAGSVTTYTAQWTINSYTVTFMAGTNGAMSPEPATANVNHGSSVADVPTITADTGYVFIGWESSQTNGIYDKAAVLKYPVTANVTFTALYTDSEKATVIFDYNGGTASGTASSSVSGKPGTSYAAPMPTKTGYNFAGWTPGTPSGTFGTAGSVTTYTAQWTINNYTVTFAEGTNGTMSGSGTESVSHGSSVTIVPGITANSGYVFVGWKSSETNGIYDAAGVMNYPVTAAVTFTAQYERSEKAVVIFDFDGGTDASGNAYVIMSDYQGEALATPASPTRTGYDFIGWNTTPSLVFGAAGSITIYTAQWTVKSYTVTFDEGAHGSTADALTESVNHGSNVTNVPDITADTGYVFIGWSDGNGIYDEAALMSYIITADVTFTAQYTDSANATVIFDYNGGTAGSSTSSSVSGKPGTSYSTPTPTKTGYTLSGWTPDTPDETFGNPNSVTTYTAQWKPDSHTVTYKANGGTGSDFTADTTYDAAYVTATVEATGISRNGHIFKGWNILGDGSGTNYAAGDTIMITGDMTLFAQWQAATYSLAYKNLNGAANNNPATYTYGSGFALKDPASRTGYTFTGWYDAASGGSQVTAIDNTDTGDKTLYAHWVANQYTITIKVVDTDGKSISGGSLDWKVDKGYQESFTAMAPTIQNYTYQYWTLNGTKQSGEIKINAVDAEAEITLVYQKQANGTDDGNYLFIKKPNVKQVSPGETVSYTFTGFGNQWDVPLERYEISDIPDKGLDFKSADVPAFNNGSGVTYDVIYYTNQKGRTVLHSDIPADRAYSFKAPALAAGEYITAVNLVFSEVPAGFGVGNTLTMTFRVWDNPPSKTLVNAGVLSYYVDGEYRSFVTGGGSGSITIGGYFDSPKTGDVNNLGLWIALLAISFGSIITLFMTKYRKKLEERRQNEN